MKSKTLRASDEEFELLLSGYFDGALSPEESARVEACLAEDPTAEAQLERFTRLQDSLRLSYQAEADAVDYGRIWSGAEEALAEIDAQRQAVRGPEAVPSLWLRLRRWWTSPGMQPLGIGMAMAAVALVAFGLPTVYDTLRSSGGEGLVAGNGPGDAAESSPAQQGDPAQQVGGAVPLDQTGEVVAAADPVSIDGVEVTEVMGGSASTVVVVSAPGSATFIWVHENDAEGGTSI